MAITLMTMLARLGLDSGGFVDGMDAASKVADKGCGNITRSLSNVGFNILKVGAIAGAAAVVGLGIALGSTIGPASDLAETVSKAGVVFGDQADKVIGFGKKAATSLGMSENAALTAAGTYGNLFRSMNMAEEASADMSIGLVQVAGDLASFNNMDPTEVMDKLRAGLTGESEPLKSLGVNINEAVIKAKAMELGLTSLDGTLAAAGKAQAVYALVMEQTSLAQGDFTRTSKGLANQQRILKATFENVRATIGTALLPAVNAFMNVINGIVSSEGFQKWLEKAIAWLSALASKAEYVIGVMVAVFGDLFSGDIGLAIDDFFEGFYDQLSAMGINVPAAKQFVQDFVDTIRGLITTVGSFVTGNAEAFKGAIIAIGGVLATAMIASKIGEIASALTSLTSPVGIVIAVVALLGAAWAGNWGGIQEKTKAVIDWMTPYVNGAITAISTWWAANGATIIGTVTATWAWIQATFQAAVDFIKPAVSGALSAIKGWWDVWGGQVMSAVTNIWNFIQNAFTVAFNIVKAIVETAWGVIQQIWERYGAQIMAVITNVWTIIQTIFGTAFTFIKTLFEGFVLLFNGDLEGFAMKVTEAFIGLWEGVKTIVSLAWENIKLVAAVAMDALGLALTAAWTWIKGIFTGAWDAIVLYITNSWEAFKAAVSTIVTNVIAFFMDTDWATVGSNIIGGIVAGISSAAQWLWDTVTNLLTGLLDKIKEFFGIASPSKLMAAKIGEPLIQGIGTGMEKAMKLLEMTQLPDMTARLIAEPSGQIADLQSGNNGQSGAQGKQSGSPIFNLNFYGDNVKPREVEDGVLQAMRAGGL